jgi:hypothetical protein
MSLSLAALAARQAVTSSRLSAELRAHVKGDRFAIVTSVRGLPLGVRGGLQTLFGSQSLDIAEPGEKFDLSDMSIYLSLPIRRMVAAGCSYERCLVYYERIDAKSHTWRVALFHWTPEATRFEWGGTAPGGLAAIDDVQRAVLSGSIKDSPAVW